MLPRLVTIPVSHYGERARWALDHAGVRYEEEHHLQFFSWFSALRLSGRKTLPVLVTEGGVLGDSSDIVRWASARAAERLYPDDPGEMREIERLERHLCDEYGVETRKIAYTWFLRSVEACLPYNAGRAPWWEARLLSAMREPAMRFVHRYLDLPSASAAIATVDRTLDDVAKTLRDGRRYLVGERFSAADLAFATMSAPILAPREYGVSLPKLEELDTQAAERIKMWRLYPAGRFALRMYADHRAMPRRVWPKAA
jgi:glutathione S-transferase